MRGVYEAVNAYPLGAALRVAVLLLAVWLLRAVTVPIAVLVLVATRVAQRLETAVLAEVPAAPARPARTEGVSA